MMAIRRLWMPGVSAFFVLAGTILARFTGEATPPAHLVRPLLAAVVVALVAGVIAGLTERGWVAAVAVAVFIPSELGLLLPGRHDNLDGGPRFRSTVRSDN